MSTAASRAATALCAALAVALPGAARPQAVPADYQQVLAYLGRQGDYKAAVLRVSVPRSDLKVTVDGVGTPTPFGFGGWLAMTRGDHGMSVMMGDLVLLQDEVNPVMSALLDNGLEVTALHNHFFWEEPRVFYMHVHGMGRPSDLARRVKPALDLLGHVPVAHAEEPWHRVLTASVESAVPVGAGGLDTQELTRIIGHAGEQSGPVFKVTIGRDDLHVRDMGATINSRMGLNTWAAFVGTDASAAVAGDIAMTEPEVTPVLKALRAHGLDVVAIHHHMTGTQPMIIFLHYWGKGPAQDLARGFRAALEELGKTHAGHTMSH